MAAALEPGLPAGRLAVVLGTSRQGRWLLGLSWLCRLCLRHFPLRRGLRENKLTVTILSKYTTKNSTDGFSDENKPQERLFKEWEWCHCKFHQVTLNLLFGELRVHLLCLFFC